MMTRRPGSRVETYERCFQGELSASEKKQLLDLAEDLPNLVRDWRTQDECFEKDKRLKDQFENYKRETSNYVTYGEIGGFVDWEKFSHNKIPKSDPSIDQKKIDDAFGRASQPNSIFVKGEDYGSGDSPAYYSEYEEKLYSDIESFCKKYKSKDIQKDIRSRIQSMLREMEMREVEIENGVDNLTPKEKKKEKILQERKRVRDRATEVLDKQCPA